MLKIVHTSDWHLGHELASFSRLDEQRALLSSIGDIVAREHPDALLVCGDIFHTATPSNAVMTLLAEELDLIRTKAPGVRIILTAGNHDSGSRLETMRAPWLHLGVDIVGRVVRDSSGAIDFSRHIIVIEDNATKAPKGVIVALPHIFDRGYPAVDDTPGDSAAQKRRFLEFMNAFAAQASGMKIPVVAMAHIALDGCEWRGHDHIEAISKERAEIIGGLEVTTRDSLPVDCDYLAMGHIHCPQTFVSATGQTARYSGSPLAISFDEDYPHSVSIVTLTAPGARPEVRTERLDPLRPLVTLPPAGDPPYTFEAALEAIAAYPSEAYLRIRVAIERVPPAGAVERATKAAESSPARFCKFVWERPGNSQTSHAPLPTAADLDAFRNLDPIDVADRFYASRFGDSMPDDLRDLFSNVLDNISQEES